MWAYDMTYKPYGGPKWALSGPINLYDIGSGPCVGL